MGASNNLSGQRISNSQATGQHTSSNDADNAIDAALTEALTIAVSSSNVVDVASSVLASAVQFRIINAGTPPTAAITINLISGTKRGIFMMINETSFDATIIIPAQSLTAPKLKSGSIGLYQNDGINVRELTSSPGIPIPITFSAKPPAYSAGVDGLYLIPITRYMQFLAAAPGSSGKAKVAATAQKDFTVNKNGGAAFVTVRFAASGTVPTFISVTPTDFVPGDWIEIITPATQDATLAQLGITLLFVPS